jgi:adenylyltransferase/sulfurtransferase
MLSSSELQRYARQITLPEIGRSGQETLSAARVLIVGAGGLGSPAALYLAAAGVGTLGLVDFDLVDASNLHRQLLHGTEDVGRRKVESAADRLRDVNPHVALELHPVNISAANALQIAGAYDLIVDGSDNFPTRYLLNDTAVLSGIRTVFGSVERFDGQVSVFGDSNGPCYRCLFREPPPAHLVPTCAEAGVFGVMPGLVGMIQATEVIKLVTGIGEPLIGRLLTIDAKRMRFRAIEVRRDPQCPLCGTREQRSLIDYDAFCGVGARASGESVNALEIEPRALAQRLSAGSVPVLIDVREPWEHELVRLPGSRLMPGRMLAISDPDLPRDAEIILYCHSGQRSHYWLNELRARGFSRVAHLRGGIDAWSVEVDPSLPRY